MKINEILVEDTTVIPPDDWKPGAVAPTGTAAAQYATDIAAAIRGRSGNFTKATDPSLEVAPIKTKIGNWEKTSTEWINDKNQAATASQSNALDAKWTKFVQDKAKEKSSVIAPTATAKPATPTATAKPATPTATAKPKRPNSVKLPSGEIITYDYDSKTWTDDNDNQIVIPSDVARLNSMLRTKLQNYQMSLK